jgi:hypothetical protein
MQYFQLHCSPHPYVCTSLRHITSCKDYQCTLDFSDGLLFVLTPRRVILSFGKSSKATKCSLWEVILFLEYRILLSPFFILILYNSSPVTFIPTFVEFLEQLRSCSLTVRYPDHTFSFLLLY